MKPPPPAPASTCLTFRLRRAFATLVACALGSAVAAPPAATPDARTFHLIHSGQIAPAYPVRYQPASIAEVNEVLQRIHGYLDATTPTRLIDRESGAEVTDLAQVNANTELARGDFLIVSYEWGVTYSGMLAAAAATGDERYREYTARRLEFLARIEPVFRPLIERAEPGAARRFTLRPMVAPRSLDDAGSFAAGLLKAQRAGVDVNLRPVIDRYLAWITEGEYRLGDGTLARRGPYEETLWLDDLYMSVPALAQMGALTGERRYFDDAVRQVRQFAARMQVPETGLFRHGWTAAMREHPTFHWARANGWAVMAMVELLDVLPEDHPGYAPVREILLNQLRALAARQGLNGRWHQLLDRPDTYEETSASAMFVYGLARAINRGWLDPLAYGQLTALGWNGVADRVNERGQVTGTCVGTGMAWVPMFYAYRPTSEYAAHGYGPALLAGAEMIRLLQRPDAATIVNGHRPGAR